MCDKFERVIVCVNATSTDIENYSEKSFQRHVGKTTSIELHPFLGTICADDEVLKRAKIINNNNNNNNNNDGLPSLTIPKLSTIVFVQQRIRT